MDCPTQYNPPPQTRPVWHWVAGGVVVVGALGAVAYFANQAQATEAVEEGLYQNASGTEAEWKIVEKGDAYSGHVKVLGERAGAWQMIVEGGSIDSTRAAIHAYLTARDYTSTDTTKVFIESGQYHNIGDNSKKAYWRIESDGELFSGFIQLGHGSRAGEWVPVSTASDVDALKGAIQSYFNNRGYAPG